MFYFMLMEGRWLDFIDIIRANSIRLLVILYSNQFYNKAVGSLVFFTTMFDYGKNTVCTANMYYAKSVSFFLTRGITSSFGCAGLTGNILNVFWFRHKEPKSLFFHVYLFLTLYVHCYATIHASNKSKENICSVLNDLYPCTGKCHFFII